MVASHTHLVILDNDTDNQAISPVGYYSHRGGLDEGEIEPGKCADRCDKSKNVTKCREILNNWNYCGNATTVDGWLTVAKSHGNWMDCSKCNESQLEQMPPSLNVAESPTVQSSHNTPVDVSPAFAQPQPYVAQPQPYVAQPQPYVAQPQPYVAQPQPYVAQP